MTEKIYPMSADFFDNSSNSSNLLKLDIFPSEFLLGSGSNSNSNSSLSLSNLAGFVSKNFSNSSTTNQPTSITIVTTTIPQSSSSILQGQNSSSNIRSNINQCTTNNTSTTPTSSSSMENLRDNPMFNSTASISIPQRSNIGIGGHSNNSNNIYFNQSRNMADFTDYGLDVLDTSSLSPTFVAESNLGLTQNSNTNSSSSLPTNYNNLIFINNASSSPLNISQSNLGNNHFINNNNDNNLHSNNNNNNNNNNSGHLFNSITNIGGGVGGGSGNNLNSATISTPTNDYIIYEIPTTAITTNSNTMWSDIGNAMITTKTEPFPMEDDYIFQLDKADLIHSPTLAELNDETLLEDLNIEDLIQTENETTYLTSHQLHQLQSVNNSGITSHQLLDQQHNSGGSNSSIGQQHNQMHSVSVGIPMQTNQTNYHNMNSGKIYEDQNTCSSSSPYEIQHSTPIKNYQSTNLAFSPGSQTSTSPLLIQSHTPPLNQNQNFMRKQNPLLQKVSGTNKVTPIHELILRQNISQSPDRSSMLGQSVPGPSTSHILMSGNALSPVSSGFGSISGQSNNSRKSGLTHNGASSSRLSSSAPTHLHLDEIMQQRRNDFPFDHPIWRRREPRQHLLSTGSSIAEADSVSSLSTASILSPEHDEGYSDYDSDHSDEYSSDGSDNDDDTPRGSHKGKERYFWQYNVQAKGPKGQRLVIKTQLEDPHVLNEVTDPVFSPNCSVRGIKHSGKARKGDGNDLTPNPRKLFSIGRELEKLGRQINDMPPVSELPTTTRQKTRKEKNKLASRACRLKKKAQHEANKIKLYGLELEHKKLMNGIQDVKNCLALKYQNQNPNMMNQKETNEEISNQIENIATTSTTIQIAGISTEFVNTVLDKVKGGLPSGGLEDLRDM